MEAMYNLPKFERTWVRTLNGEGGPWTYLFTERNNEDFWISRFPGTVSHVVAFAKHTATVRRFRRIQRLWKWGGKYFFRARLLQALYS
jgi:hypothetical protein